MLLATAGTETRQLDIRMCLSEDPVTIDAKEMANMLEDSLYLPASQTGPIAALARFLARPLADLESFRLVGG
jgi:hypothetical protein